MRGENVVREERRSRNWALELSFFVAGFHQRSQMTRCVPCPAAVPTVGLQPPTPQLHAVDAASGLCKRLAPPAQNDES